MTIDSISPSSFAGDGLHPGAAPRDLGADLPDCKAPAPVGCLQQSRRDVAAETCAFDLFQTLAVRAQCPQEGNPLNRFCLAASPTATTASRSSREG